MRLLSPFPNAEKLKTTSPPGPDITGSPGQCILAARGWAERVVPWAFIPTRVPQHPLHTPTPPLPCSPSPSAARCLPVAPSLPQTSSASPCSRWRKPRSGSRTGASRSRSPSESPGREGCTTWCGTPRGCLPLHTSPCSAPSLLCSFYKANHVQKFSYSRPFKKGPKDPDNEFAVSASRGCRDPRTGGKTELQGPYEEPGLKGMQRDGGLWSWDREGGSPVWEPPTLWGRWGHPGVTGSGAAQ